MYGSAFGDNTQDHHGEMFLPLQQQPQQPQQPQHQSQQSYSHSFEPDTQHKQQSAGNSDFFLSLTDQEQQAILMSEPNFLRQQHLLHDNEVKIKMEKQDDKQQLQDGNSDTGIPMRSNLSAMFDQSTPTDNHSDLASSVPAHSTNDLLQPPYQSTQHTITNQQHQTQQQPTPAIMTKPVSSSSKSRKEINRRSQQGAGGRSNHRTTPIPINGGSSSGSISKQSSSVPSEIDHQRRFNELQARFRVNYARKPTTSGNSTSTSTSSQQNHQQQQPPPPPSSSSQQRQQQQIHASSPSTTKTLSSSFSGPSTNGFGSYGRTDVNSGATFGSSVPKSIDKINVDSSVGGGTNSEKNTDRSSNNNHHHSSSTTTSATSTMGVAIPSGNKNSSSSGGGKEASSFPSRTMPIQIQRVHRANANQPMDAEQHQKRLDDQLVKANFDDITVSELKEMLRQRGKPATGKKAILLQRLVEERDIIKAVRGGKITHRHSQPPPQSSSSSTAAINHSTFENTNNTGLSPRPRSYQGSSPMFGHATLPPNSPLLDSPSSVPNSSMFLSSSPGSATLSLNRSIANMHIGSPPLSSQHVRRFSPYGTPGSPRLGSSSPKMQMQRQAYSSSVPSDYLSSSPGGGTGGGGGMALPPSFNNFGNDGYSNSNSNTTATSPMSPGPPNSTRNMRLYHQNQTWNSRQKSYAPFTSSALATPDRDDEDDPFDVMAREQENVDMEGGQEQESQGPVQSQPLYDSLYQLQQHQQYDEQRQRYDQQDQPQQQQQYQQQSGMDMEGVKEESMEWVNNSSTGDQSLHGLLQDLPEGVSTEQFMAWFATMNAGTNEFDQFNLNMDAIKTENIDLSGMMAMDTNNTNYVDGSSYGHQQQQQQQHHHHHHGGTDYTN
ncbi:unnamed protein product [Absidia cylindrospora]